MMMDVGQPDRTPLLQLFNTRAASPLSALQHYDDLIRRSCNLFLLLHMHCSHFGSPIEMTTILIFILLLGFPFGVIRVRRSLSVADGIAQELVARGLSLDQP